MLMDVFIARALAHCAIEAIVFAIVLSGLAMLGFDVLPPAPIEFGGVLLLTVALAFGLGLLFAALGSVVPDSKAVIASCFCRCISPPASCFRSRDFPDEWIDCWRSILCCIWSRCRAAAGVAALRAHAAARPLLSAGARNGMRSSCGLAMYRLRYLSRVTT